MKEQTYAAVAGTATVAGLSLSLVNDWLQALALLVAIVSGVLAIRAHFKRDSDA